MGRRDQSPPVATPHESGPDTVFRLQKISKVYQMGETEIHALRDVDLELYSGEFVVLLGASGSGKSTLLNILGGLLRACIPEPLLQSNRINQSRVVAGDPASDSEAQALVESDALWIIGSGLEPDQPYSSRMGAGLEPQDYGPSKPPPAVRRLNTQQDQMRRFVSVFHDSESQEAAVLINNGDVCKSAADGPKDACRRPSPR